MTRTSHQSAEDKSILQRYPVQSLYIAATVLAVIGGILMLTVVGSIIGLPLWGLAAILALLGMWKSRSHENEQLRR